jgi:flagellar protein FlaG
MSSPVMPVDAAQPVQVVQSREPRFQTVEHGESATDVLSDLKAVGSKIDLGNRSAVFSFDQTTGRVVVKIVTNDTNPPEVVRQIPPEEYLNFVTKVRELFGVLFDQKL